MLNCLPTCAQTLACDAMSRSGSAIGIIRSIVLTSDIRVMSTTARERFVGVAGGRSILAVAPEGATGAACISSGAGAAWPADNAAPGAENLAVENCPTNDPGGDGPAPSGSVVLCPGPVADSRAGAWTVLSKAGAESATAASGSIFGSE